MDDTTDSKHIDAFTCPEQILRDLLNFQIEWQAMFEALEAASLYQSDVKNAYFESMFPAVIRAQETLRAYDEAITDPNVCKCLGFQHEQHCPLWEMSF